MEKNETKIAKTDCEKYQQLNHEFKTHSVSSMKGYNTYKDLRHDNLARGFDTNISELMYHITQNTDEDNGEEELKETDKPREGFRDITGGHFEGVLIF